MYIYIGFVIVYIYVCIYIYICFITNFSFPFPAGYSSGSAGGSVYPPEAPNPVLAPAPEQADVMSLGIFGCPLGGYADPGTESMTQPGFVEQPVRAMGAGGGSGYVSAGSDGAVGAGPPRESGPRHLNSMDSFPETQTADAAAWGDGMNDEAVRQLEREFDAAAQAAELEEEMGRRKRKMDEEMDLRLAEHQRMMERMDRDYNDRCKRHKVEMLRMQDEEKELWGRVKNAQQELNTVKKESNKRRVQACFICKVFKPTLIH